MRRGVRPRLRHLNPSGRFASGNVRYYYRPKGEKGIRMPDLPEDHPEFLAAYAKAAGVKPRRPVREGSLAAGIALYKGSDSFAALSVGTQNARRPMLDDLAERYGHADRAGLTPRHIEKDLQRFRGHVRNNHLKMWRGFCKWLVQYDGLSHDPSDGVRKAKTQKTKGHIAWSVEQVEQFRAYWPLGSMERLAFELIYWTGARVSDAVRLGPQNIERDGFLTFFQQKTGGEVFVPFNCRLPEFAERYAEDLAQLKAAIAARNERHLTYLHTSQGAARSSKSISQWFASKARAASIERRTAHGLRKSRAKALAESGGTSTQIGAWTGHESLKEIEHYIRDYSKKQALSRTDEEQKVPTSPIKFQKGGK